MATATAPAPAATGIVERRQMYIDGRWCDADSGATLGVINPADESTIAEVTYGGKAEALRAIEAAAKALGADIGTQRLVDAPHSHAAAAQAVALAQAGEVEALMKGSLHTDELMAEVVRREGGLRTDRRLSHCFVMDVPNHGDTLIVSDGAVNIAPTVEDKVDIIQNAIDLAHALQQKEARVAILSAMETVNTKLASTMDAAALCKMADRGQINGAELDGPLAFDNAVSPDAARIKGIRSAVAGQAQILMVPDLEAGNMLAKNLTLLSNADAAGIVLGTRVPIILTSRADEVRTRMTSCAVAAIYANQLRSKQPVRS